MDTEKSGKAILAQIGLIAVIAIAMLCVSRLVAKSIDSWGAAQLAVGSPAPAVHLRTLNGSPIELADLKGKIAILIYTSEKCPVSAAYRDRIATLAKSYSNDPRLVVMEINGDVALGRLSQTQLADAVHLQRPNHPVLIDSDGTFAEHYGTTVTPTCYVIGPDGILRYSGSFDDSADPAKVHRRYIAEAIGHLLDGSPIEITATRPFGCRIH